MLFWPGFKTIQGRPTGPPNLHNTRADKTHSDCTLHMYSNIAVGVISVQALEAKIQANVSEF